MTALNIILLIVIGFFFVVYGIILLEVPVRKFGYWLDRLSALNKSLGEDNNDLGAKSFYSYMVRLIREERRRRGMIR